MRRALLLVVTVVMSACLLSSSAGADESVGKGLEGSFTLKGTHGYLIKGLIGATGKGDGGGLILSVSRRGEAATYFAHGTVTKEAIDFDLGPLGEFDAAVQPSGKKETLTSGCGSGEEQTFEGQEYVGTLAFHGEEGFTEAEATSAPLVLGAALSELVCDISSSDQETGVTLPGAELAIKKEGGPSLQLSQNHPGARVFYNADIHEKEGAVTVDRTVGGYLPGSAMTYSSTLMAAHFSSRSPFSGVAAYKGTTPYRETRPGKGLWRGNLTVDFPGHADVPLAGPGFKASIVPVHRDRTRKIERH